MRMKLRAPRSKVNISYMRYRELAIATLVQ